MASNPHLRTVRLDVRVTWWLRLYLYGLATTVALTGCQPNWQHVNGWIKRGIKVRVRGTRRWLK